MKNKCFVCFYKKPLVYFTHIDIEGGPKMGPLHLTTCIFKTCYKVCKTGMVWKAAPENW